MTTALRFACHVAHLDPVTGSGLLVLPRPEDDQAVGLPSLHGASWDYVLRELDQLGWELAEDEDGGLCHEGLTPDGREIVGLYGREPITSDPSLEECADAFARLRERVLVG